MNDFQLWHEILDYGLWAPSPHNVQPWKVKLLSPTKAQLYYEPSRLLPVEDPTNRFLLCGFGIFIETLNIAAKAKGFEIQSEFETLHLDPSAKTPTAFGWLELKPTTESDALKPELIKKRRTSRFPYTKQTLPREVMDELIAEATKFDSSFTFSTDPKIVDWVIHLNKDTMFDDMKIQDTRDEIGHWTRYSLSQAQKTKDGLWAYCMNIASPLLWLFFKAHQILELPIIFSIIQRYYLYLTFAPTVGWLQSPFQTPENHLKAGRMLARLWLIMTKHNVYMHPFGSIITNHESHARLRAKFDLDETEKTIWLIMRLGYSAQPPRSMRLGLTDIILQ